MLYLTESEFIGCKSGHIVFSNNLGSIVGFSSNITFSGYAIFVNNKLGLSQNGAGTFQGGAITLFHSNLVFDATCNLEHNHAENGGAIHSVNSKLYVNGNVTIANNTATGNGGGMYLSTSELNCQQESNFVLYNNTAMSKGGGLHVISSSITAASDFDNDHRSFHRYIGARVNFTNNAAKFGGGLSLEANAKMYILKYDKNYEDDVITTIFTGNSADYGGAVYVDDDTNFGTYASDPRTECFFQVLALYGATQPDLLRTQAVHFAQNYAKISGSTLYGGLLDRCAVSQFGEIYRKYFNIIGGINYFKNISVGITDASISSDPVRVCPCINNVHNCDNKSHNSIIIKHIKKGETFPVSFVAVDQVGHPVSAIIRTSLNFSDSGLGEGQLERNISTECTELIFNVVSLHSSEKMILYASGGPCKDAKLSRATVELHFLPCSCLIGLQVSGATNINTNCTCQCHRDISRYMERCDRHDGSLVKQPQSRAWISYINDTNQSGYLVYPNCPFDYCLSTSPPVNLNQLDGADAQCAFNRSSLLCGSCQPGLSLSLGSSRCLLCPNYWPALLITITIAAIFAGIALVTLLLVLNMTVAVGTLNGLIFYVNVVYVNKSILLPFQETNFITVFISWLNLDLGIDTCYFPGMDSYIKTWLQLAFPAYVFLLVYLIIYISSKSTTFLRQIRKKDPVATLATLIMLSYTKLVEVCFRSLSFGVLAYPDGSNVSLWLPDANIKYLSVKHIPLFITGILILLVGLIFPILLSLWQFLLRLPKGRISKLTENVRIKSFIEYYHKPYTAQHRYWTGLLLIVRIILYLVASTNVCNDPTVAITAIIVTVILIFALRLFFGSRVYEKWPVDMLETFFCWNILLLATFTWYCLDNPDSKKEAPAYTSVTITIIALLLIIFYHVYTYTFTTLLSKVKKIKLGKVDHVDGPVNADDDETTPLLRPTPVEPTSSVVELHHPCLATLDPKESNAQNIPADSAEEVVQKEVVRRDSHKQYSSKVTSA